MFFNACAASSTLGVPFVSQRNPAPAFHDDGGERLFDLVAANRKPASEPLHYWQWECRKDSPHREGIKVILANPAMLKAYRSGIPGNGKPFPDGSKVAKIEWTSKKSAESPYFVMVPDTLKSVSFIEKDIKRFPDTHGW